MIFIRTLAGSLLFALAACATIPTTAVQFPHHYVMRHLNTPAGERDPDLTAEGAAAAARLPQLFATVRPAAIYVTNYKRSIRTAEAVARRFGLTPIVYDPADTPGLVARVRAGPAPALIIGHSNTVPDIVEQLGGPRPAPLAHENFGDIWLVEANGVTRKLRIP